MSSNKKIKSALISVFHKDNLKPIVKRLNDLGVTIYSTGGTQGFIEAEGISVTAVEDLTSYLNQFYQQTEIVPFLRNHHRSKKRNSRQEQVLHCQIHSPS